MNIAIIGKGNVGSAIEAGLSGKGHDVRTVGRDPQAVRSAAEQAELVILAVPFEEIDNLVGELGDTVSGKTVVDATNALTPEYDLAIGFETSGAEELQKKLPGSKIVKAFNTAFASAMSSGRINGQQLAGLVAANDVDAKSKVLGLLEEIGFDPIDAGPLASARLLEPLGVLNIKLGFVQGYGPNSGFQLVH